MLIVVYDTGIGGLAALRESVLIVPGARWIYIADETVFPAGMRSADEVTRRLEQMSDMLTPIAPDVILPASSVCWPALGAFNVPAALTIDPVPTVSRAIRAIGGTTGLLAPTVVLESGLPRRICGDLPFVSASTVRIAALVERGVLPDNTLVDVIGDATAALRDEHLDQLLIVDSHVALVTHLVRRACGGADAVSVPRLLAAALSSHLGELEPACPDRGDRVAPGLEPRIEIWVPEPDRARVERVAREQLQVAKLTFRSLALDLPESHAEQAEENIALLAYAAFDSGSVNELRHFVAPEALPWTRAVLGNWILQQQPNRACCHMIDGVLRSGQLVGITGLKRRADGSLTPFAHRLRIEGGRITDIVEVPVP